MGQVGVAADSSDDIYVTDWGSERVLKFTSGGRFLTQWGAPGSGPGQFDQPSGVAVDSSGNVYVADTVNNRVEKFKPIAIFVPPPPECGLLKAEFLKALELHNQNPTAATTTALRKAWKRYETVCLRI